MYKLTAENKYGQQIQLTQNPNYDVLGIVGLTPASAVINTDTVAASDGARFNSSKVDMRNIVITLSYRQKVEANRIALYQFFKTKQYVKLYYTNAHRDVYIEGYVETFEGDLFQLGQQAQISIICPNPYFKSVNDVITPFSAVVDALEFPVEFPEAGIPFSTEFSYLEGDVANTGDAESGVIIELYARGAVTNPTLYNLTTGEQFNIQIEMETGDVITIDTNSGEKGITLLRDGLTTNLINKVYKNSDWFTLEAGDNIFSYTAESGMNMLDVTFTTTPLYEGV